MRSPLLPIFAGCLTAMAVLAGATLGLMPRAIAADGTLAAAQRELPAEMQKRETWRKSLLLVPLPAKGCFTAAYPDKGWRPVPCKPSTPHKLFLPHAGGITQIDTVGGSGPDFSAVVTGHISTAEGSFDSATGITSNNAYSLQLNTQHFTTSACSGSPNNTGSLTTGCRGWEQFVYESGGSAFTQYWLLDYGPWGTTQCPVPRHVGCAVGASYSDGWCPVQISLEGGDANQTQCVINAVHEPTVPAESMASLGQLKVAGSAGATGDTLTVTVGGTPNPVSGDNRLPGLNANWKEAEFNVFGGGNSAATAFNSGTNIVVRTQVISGTNIGPLCDLRSFTGESTNLTLGNTPPASPGPPGPALVFSQSYPAPTGGLASCADATSIGDTHQRTFGGLLYDFQAAGDFLLADTGRDFIVETRQVSGKPTWPDADVNSAVAVRTDGHRIAICTPDRVVIDGKPAAFGDRKSIGFPGGGGIAHKDNTYTVFSAAGDSVHAEMNGTYINVSVGLGKWPSTVRGLLSNANTVHQIAARDGQVFTANFSFDDLYHHYADSWRVPAKETLLSDCGPAREIGIAKAPFYAKDLDPKLAERARAICTEAGVKNGALFDACVLDVVVLKSPAAAKVYTHARAPVAVGLIVQREPAGGRQ